MYVHTITQNMDLSSRAIRVSSLDMVYLVLYQFPTLFFICFRQIINQII